MDQIEKFVKDSGLRIPAYNVCFYDSNGTDEILDNILCGKKRANTGLFNLFEAQMQLLPRTGDYTVVLDSDMQPRYQVLRIRFYLRIWTMTHSFCKWILHHKGGGCPV